MKATNDLREAAAALGRRGGQARARALTTARRSEIARIANAARLAKRLAASSSTARP
jgi:hypothetical protein